MSTPVPLRMRPLEIGDLLDETFRMYRRHFLLFAGISVILAIPSAALVGLVFASLSSVVGETGQTDFAAFTPFLESLGAAVIVSVVILPFTQGAVMYAACESALGRPVTAGGVFMGVLRRYFPLLGYWLLFALTGYLAAALCLVPLVLWAWVFVLWSVATPAMFVENIGLGAAMSRSRYLVQGRWWRTFLVLLLMVVVWYLSRVALGAFLQLGQVLLTIVFSPFIVSAIALAGSQLVGALVTPVLQITIVLIYFDLRVRREALDLFQMAYRIASPAATS